MKRNARQPLWREGLFLSPQHFQVMDQHQQWFSWVLASSLTPFPWGIIDMEVDAAAVANGELRLTRIIAVLPDGTFVNAPAADVLPPSKNFRESISADNPSALAYLAVPKVNLGRSNIRTSPDETGQRTRYQRVVEPVTDYTSAGRQREVEFVATTPEVRIEGQPLDHFDLLPVARVVLSVNGLPILDPDYLPSCLHLESCAGWTKALESVYARVKGWTRELSDRLTYHGDQQVSLSIADLPDYLLARELIGVLPILQNLTANLKTHPIHFYCVLAQLVGGLELLMRSGNSGSGSEFPPYNHSDPSGGLKELMTRLESCLFKISDRPKGGFELVVVDGSPDLYQCDLMDEKLLGNEEFYIWAQADLSEEELISRFPSLGKIASPKQMPELVMYGVPGCKIEATINRPDALKAPHGGYYFRIDKRDGVWEQVLAQRSMQVFAPADQFPEFKCRLHILRP